MKRFLNIAGFSLVEVLMSLLLISLILFGLDAAELYSIKEAKTAWFYSVAENQLNNAIERLVALKTDEGLDNEIVDWNLENKAMLPSGSGDITDSFPNYRIIIYWGNHIKGCKKQQLGSSGCLSEKISLE